MDYSTIPNDPEHPGGGDPWASPSQQNRPFAQPPTSDIPSSPLPPQASPYAQQSEQYGYMGGPDGQHRPATSSDEPQSPHAQQQAPAQGQQGQREQPQRYHGTRQQAQPPRTQYKLQAKITGLERTGRKDPILRFDVHVSGRSLVNMAMH